MSQIYEDGQHELLRELPEFKRSSRAIGVNKFGLNPTATANLSDIWDLAPTQELWVPPTQARVHSIVSTSINDTNTAGTYARTIRVYGFDK